MTQPPTITVPLPEPIGPQTPDDLRAWRKGLGLTHVQAGLTCGLAIYRNPKTGSTACRHWQAMEAGERGIPNYVSIICAYVTAYGFPPK